MTIELTYMDILVTNIVLHQLIFISKKSISSITDIFGLFFSWNDCRKSFFATILALTDACAMVGDYGSVEKTSKNVHVMNII